MPRKAASKMRTSTSTTVNKSTHKRSRKNGTVELITSSSGKKRVTAIPNLLKNSPFYIKFY